MILKLAAGGTRKQDSLTPAGFLTTLATPVVQVRATRAVKIQCDKAIYGLQQLLHLPSSRAFCDVRVLSVTSYEDRSMAEWACFSDALAAAAATWPSMEEVLLNAKLMEKRQYNNHEW
jgi:hypothetical protein